MADIAVGIVVATGLVSGVWAVAPANAADEETTVTIASGRPGGLYHPVAGAIWGVATHRGGPGVYHAYRGGFLEHIVKMAEVAAGHLTAILDSGLDTADLTEAVTDGQGHVLYPAGTRANPLDVVSLAEPILFFDARDPAQVAVAERMRAAQDDRIIPILVAGSWVELNLKWKRQVFYDQRGELTTKLGVRAVPALVVQEGRALRVTEFAP